MYNRQQYEQHMSAFRPGMVARPGLAMRPGFMPPQRMVEPGQRFPHHGQMSDMETMGRMGGMAPRMDMARMNSAMPQHPGMMGPGMMPGMGAGMMQGQGGSHMPGQGFPGQGNMSGMGNMRPNIAASPMLPGQSVMPPAGSPGALQQPARSPQQLFQQSGQYRHPSPQYQQGSYANSPTYPGPGGAGGQASYPRPPTPGSGYSQPLTPGYTKPPTPQMQNPLTPGGSYQSPTTPGGSYPAPSTPVSHQSPLTPQPPDPPPAIQPQLNSFNPPKAEQVPNIFKTEGSKLTTPMLSPPAGVLTSDLRKIRRPSKSVTPGTVSPNQKTLSPNQAKEFIKSEPDQLVEPKKEPADFESLVDSRPDSRTAAGQQMSSVKSEPTVPTPSVKKEPESPKRPKSPSPPPRPAKTPEPPREPRWGEDGEDGLPDKVLKHIFSYICYSSGCLPFLPSAMRVCKFWNRIAKDQSLWTHANLGNNIKEKSRTEKKLDWILKNKFPLALEVDVHNWRAAISAPALKIIAANCPNLIGLGLSSCVKLQHEDVRIIPSLFPNLQKIDFSCVSVSHFTSLTILQFF